MYLIQIYYRICSPELRRRVRTQRVFKGGVKGHVRVIKSTDESMLRDLFYNLSEESVIFPILQYPLKHAHKNLEQYINVTETDGLSLVARLVPGRIARSLQKHAT